MPINFLFNNFFNIFIYGFSVYNLLFAEITPLKTAWMTHYKLKN